MPPLPIWFRRALTLQVLALPILLVAYAVVMVGATLLQSMGDEAGSLVLRWVGSVLVILFAVAALGLLFLLGWERLSAAEEDLE